MHFKFWSASSFLCSFQRGNCQFQRAELPVPTCGTNSFAYCYCVHIHRKNTFQLALRLAIFHFSKKIHKRFGGIKFYTYLCRKRKMYAYIAKDIRTSVLLLFGRA